MAALNAARVAFKHHGVEPAFTEAEKHVRATHRFLQETAQEFFALDFDALSEADLISEEGIRVAVKAAEDALAKDDARAALERCRDALDVLNALLKKIIPVSQEDHFGPPISLEMRRAAEGVVRWINNRFSVIEMAVSLSVLGVNPAEFWFLSGTLPHKNYAGFYHWLSPNPMLTTTPARAKASIRIIINMALRLDRFRGELKGLEIRAGLPEEQRRQKEWSDRMVSQVTTEAAKPDPSDLGSE
jgi:hypothetical protein